MNTVLIALLVSLLSTMSLSAQTSVLYDNINTPQCKAWVDSVYDSMTLDQRIAQLMIENISPAQADKSKATIRQLVAKDHVGGLYFSKGSAEEFAEMANYAQSLSRVPLVMAIDGEWGPSMRVKDAPVFPRNMTLGAIQHPALIFEYGQEVARQCRRLGIQIDFAPVLDVNSNPINPVIGDRSFGEDPLRVAQLGRAFSLGLESGGVMAVGKHFPGHGDTDTDSHKALPTVHHSMEQLNMVDLLPFKAFIDANCGGIMVGHLSVPILDATGRPTSMSKSVVTGLLKDKLGFEGLVFTDGLGMKGAAIDGNRCVGALKAGDDVLLNPMDVPHDIAAVRAAVNSGEIPESAIEERCKRVLAYKYALGLAKAPTVASAQLKADLCTPATEALMQRLADAAVTLVRDPQHLLPMADLANTSIAVVNIGADKNEFTEFCAKYAPVDVYASTDASFSSHTLADIKKHDVVIAAIYGDKAAHQHALSQLCAVERLIPVFFINPYKVAKFEASLPVSKALVMAYEDLPQLRMSAAKAMFGGIDVAGRMPVNVASVARLGEGIDVPKTRLGYSSPAAMGLDPKLTWRVDSAVNAAMADGAFPGAQVLVVKDGDVIIDRAYGYTTKGGSKVTEHTLYDLASVSKAVGTLPGVMKAYDLGLFDLDEYAYKYIPGLDLDGKREVTPKMLLHHETGIPAALNMFNVMMDSTTYTGRVLSNKRDRDHTIAITGGGYGHKDAKLRTDIISPTKTDKFDVEVAKGLYTGSMAYDTIMANIYRTDVNPQRKYRYSCLNFCLLMDLEQRLTGQSHDRWVTDSIWAPLGAYNFCYRPLQQHYPLSQIAATEYDTYLRKQHVHGYVHDELAAFSGGLQGNAGVFGTATDIAKLCQMWLNGGVYGDARVLSEATSHLFTTDKSPTCRRGLGFDKPDVDVPDNSPTCDQASASTYGHTGFTGTCFWVDPESDLIFVFLSNRVDPSRSNKAFSRSAIRPALMTMIYEAMR